MCFKMCNTGDVIKCATQMISSYGREARNYQSNRRIEAVCWRNDKLIAISATFSS